MASKVSRRDALRSVGWGALALSQARLSAACGSPGEPKPGQAEAEGGIEVETGVAAETGFAFDPTMSWWLQGPFAPMLEEHETRRLEVTGKIPLALEGTYVRNGPNPKYDRGNWLLGHGMVHGVRLQGGQASWYRNRFVRTPLLDYAPGQIANSLQQPAANASNVSLVHHAGKVLSLGEAGLPFEISADDLSTVGPYDFGGRLKTFMTAHPKIDPRTGDMHMFGYGVTAPYLTYHRVNAAGELVRSEPITLPRAVMNHDFQITQTKIVFMDLSVVFDFAQAVAGASFPFRWDESKGARLGIMPHAGGDADVTWFEIDPCFIFHGVNAYDDAMGNVVLEACRYPHFFRDDPTRFDVFPQLHRYTLNPTSKLAKVERLAERFLEFPTIDPRRVGVDYRYSYAMSNDLFNVSAPAREMALVKHDRQRGSFVVREFPLNQAVGEPLFVPAAADADEDEGFVLAFVHDQRAQRGSLEILDARDLTAPAVASVTMPWRIPFGAHGTWIPG